MDGTAVNKTFSYERAFSEIKRLASADLEGPELLRRTAERLSTAVPFGSYCVATLDPASNLITHLFNGGSAGEEGHAEVYGEALHRMYFEEDMARIATMLRERRPAQRLSEAAGGRLDHSIRYREYLGPVGFGHELAGIFADGGAWGAGYLTREKGEPDFGGGETTLVARVAPHVAAGLKAAALRSRANEARPGPGVPGVVVLDRRGAVLSYTPAAERLLSEVENLRPGWERDAPVPVTMAAGALKRALDPVTDADQNLVPRVRIRGRSGRWLTLHASLTEPASGRQSETVVVISPSEPEEVARLNVVSYGLTDREAEIVRLAARGSSTREISGTLFISEHTVNNHLRNIFEKVGVNSRRQMVQRLYLESLMPGVLGDRRREA
jgi:DNA-binding CsgD family transcriptional regulator